jgi:Fe-S cluster biogenesis protein NfuA
MTTPPGNQALIQIRGEPQADANVCRFVVDREVFSGGSYVCSNANQARGSLLLEALFVIPGITQVWIKDRMVTIQKATPSDWSTIGRQVGAAIRAQLLSGSPFMPPRNDLNPASTLAEDVSARIREVLEKQINPGVAGHGGKIDLIEVKGSAAYLKMSGGCQGCGAAQMTLKQGVEKALRASVPEITEVIDVTDHSGGKNPYYSAT